MTILELAKVDANPWGDFHLRGVDFCLSAGAVTGIIGPNGAGKTSLLQLLAGDVEPSRGDCRLLGTPMSQWDMTERARMMAVLPQLSLLNFPYSVEEVILLGRTPHGTGAAMDRRILQEVMQATDTTRLRQRFYTQLSGGEKQRVQLARVFAQIWQNEGTPRVLLLDEPTTALDLAHQQLIMASLSLLAANDCAVVMVAHDFNLVAGVADQVVAVAEGQVVAQGTPAEVLTAQLFATVFGAQVTIGAHPVSGAPLVIQL
ncbi:heme ABC transporter ATP-binding protein [Halieaceae bacterium IMCC14734]|uniref:Heme ABC transporter ATP-binding protein n=1 Tax=Candidatus Litorirhabdus singularis TaxID=2518993 RepID=A0ABT3TKZ8_9GAMM|nr:heme ABC transporter ATP-binding protein [Candidatus Litorirhabdus singularis]MCX2982988.1 heme ABC transporter ATP-binding protein [Candidatus Litorirhabdus singularis]